MFLSLANLRSTLLGIVLTLAVFSLPLITTNYQITPTAHAASRGEIEFESGEALGKLYDEVPGARDLIRKASGYLVFPEVYEAGFGFGGEYGEGKLAIKNRTNGYYNVVSASYGFKLGAQKKAIFILFMNDRELNRFLSSEGWKAGVDASVALIKVGAEGSINTTTTKKPVIGFVVGQKGLMYDLSLEGTKITKIKK